MYCIQTLFIANALLAPFPFELLVIVELCGQAQFFTLRASETRSQNFAKMQSAENISSPVKTPRKRKRQEGTITDLALKYFKEIDQANKDFQTPTKKTHSCNLCTHQLNGSNLWNLSRHLSVAHREVYFELMADKAEPVQIKRLKLLQHCTEIVSVNGRTFSALQDSGFVKIIRKFLDEFKNANCPLNLSDHNLTEVKNYLRNTASKIRDKIKAEVKGRPLSLLCDIVTKHNRHLLGVSIQYTINGQLKIRSIGLIELTKSATGKYLADLIIKRLAEFGIGLKQIFSITTDNGSNVLKMVRDMESCLRNEMNQAKNNQQPVTTSVSTSVSNDEELDLLIDELLAGAREINDDEALDMVFEEAALECNATLLKEISTEMINYGANIAWDITGVSCSAHTIQLGIKDALLKLKSKHMNVIQLCREACKFLRLKSTCIEMEENDIGYRLPRLENDTRWCSMYLMVSSFVQN